MPESQGGKPLGDPPAARASKAGGGGTATGRAHGAGGRAAKTGGGGTATGGAEGAGGRAAKKPGRGAGPGGRPLAEVAKEQAAEGLATVAPLASRWMERLLAR